MLDENKKESAFMDVEYGLPVKKRWVDWAAALVNAVLAVVSLVLALQDNSNWIGWYIILIALCCLSAALFILEGILIRYERKRKQEYLYYIASSRISDLVLKSIRKVHFMKTNYVLQSTYGSVPEWHPIDYTTNVLVYDVHEQLRKIVCCMKEVILGLRDEFTDDMVTVDVIYQYSVDRSETTKRSDNWKIITSGDNTTSGVNLHTFMERHDSFYQHILSEESVFCNNKKILMQQEHYIPSAKDNDYNNIGSVFGCVIVLKNDYPELEFVQLVLTITTYGFTFMDEKCGLSVRDFEKLFRENLVNPYKTIIESELAQMFIRHGIREGYICKETGKLKTDQLSCTQQPQNKRMYINKASGKKRFISGYRKRGIL